MPQTDPECLKLTLSSGTFINKIMIWIDGVHYVLFSVDIADTIGYLLMGSSVQASQEIEVWHWVFENLKLLTRKCYSVNKIAKQE